MTIKEILQPKKFKMSYSTWQGRFEKMIYADTIETAKDIASTMFNEGYAHNIETEEVSDDFEIKPYARLLITEIDYPKIGFRTQAVLHGGELSESIVTYLEQDEIQDFIAKASEEYNIMGEVQDWITPHLEDKVYQLYQEEKNQLRYMFRTIGRAVREKHETNSNKMIRRNVNPEINTISISSKDIDSAEQQLIEMGYLKSFTSESTRRRYKYGRVSTSYTEYIGLTSKGWQIFNKDSAKHNY